MIDIMNPKALRDRFAELGTERVAIVAESGPLRDERDELIKSCDEKTKVLSTQIANIEAGLFDIDQERALIARALGGQTGLAKPVEDQ
jgi:uncharacterized coiled-coil DUF342 family protein